MQVTNQEMPEVIIPLFDDHLSPEDIEAVHNVGAKTALLCLREQDVRRRDRHAELTETATVGRELGMDVQADLWSFANIFGGEARSWVPRQESCPDNPAVRRLLQAGVDLAAEIGASGMFWDEPNLQYCDCHKGREVPFLEKVASYAAAVSLKNTICLTSNVGNMDKLGKLAESDTIDGIGTDPYYFPGFPGEGRFGGGTDHPERYVGYYARQVKDIERRTGKTAHVWVQGFGLPMKPKDRPVSDWHAEADSRSWHDVPVMAAAAAREKGITQIGIWASRRWDIRDPRAQDIMPPFPERIWENIPKIATIDHLRGIDDEIRP